VKKKRKKIVKKDDKNDNNTENGFKMFLEHHSNSPITALICVNLNVPSSPLMNVDMFVAPKEETLALNRDWLTLYAGYANGYVIRWKINKKGKKEYDQRFLAHRYAVSALQVFGDTVFTAGTEGILNVWRNI